MIPIINLWQQNLQMILKMLLLLYMKETNYIEHFLVILQLVKWVLSSNYEYLFFNYGDGFIIDQNDKRKLKEFGGTLFLEEKGKGKIIGTYIKVLGKQINFTIYSNDKSLSPHYYRIGILNKIEDIMIYSERIVRKRIKKIKIGKIEIKKDEDKRLYSLLSLGIIKDFDCHIEFGEEFNF